MASLLLAEFVAPGPMLAAARALRKEGHPKLDSFTPYPIHGLEDALGLSRSPVSAIALAGGLTGIGVGYGMQWLFNVWSYPIIVGGRPIHSAPMFVPITFEFGILCCAFAIFFGLMFLMRFPRLHHPVFDAEGFTSASTHAYWLSVELEGPDSSGLSQRLSSLGAVSVAQVEGEP